MDQVDRIHHDLTGNGLEPVMPLEDHPWGDRGFGVMDPAGAMVCCYVPIEPSDQFRPYFRSE